MSNRQWVIGNYLLLFAHYLLQLLITHDLNILMCFAYFNKNDKAFC